MWKLTAVNGETGYLLESRIRDAVRPRYKDD